MRLFVAMMLAGLALLAGCQTKGEKKAPCPPISGFLADWFSLIDMWALFLLQTLYNEGQTPLLLPRCLPVRYVFDQMP